MTSRGTAALLVLTVIAVFVPAAPSEAAFAPDPSFGSGGFTLFDDPAGDNEKLEDLVIQPTGKILTAGARNGAAGFLLARFNADGSPDLGFGTGGIAVVPDTGEGTPRAIAGIEQRSDGKILAAGLGRGVGGVNAIMFARYTPEGELDAAWGKGGLRLFSVAPYGTADALALAPDGKVVAVGDSEKFIPVARLTEDGKNDEAFSAAPIGLRTVDVPGTTGEIAHAVEVLDDGTILLAGSAGSMGAFLAELDVNGEPVTAFGNAGIKTVDLGSVVTPSGTIEDIQVLGDGRILATGTASGGSSDNEGFVARFGSDGELDPTFAAAGVFHANPTPDTERADALAVQPDGKIVVSGMRGETSSDLTGDTWLLRLTPDGQPDPSFGLAGEAFASAGPGPDRAAGLALQADLRPLVAGFADTFEGRRLMVGRFAEEQQSPTGRAPDEIPGAKCAGRPATIVGTARADRIKGTKKADVIAARGGSDQIAGRGGNDLICAGAGKDVVKGGPGRDRLLGEGGKDELVGGPGRKDLCDGGPGKDLAAPSCERLRRVPARRP